MRHIVERRRPHRRVLVAFHWMIIRIIGRRSESTHSCSDRHALREQEAS